MQNRKNLILAMIVLGSICGLIEVVGKGLLERAGIHLSGILIGLDCILIGIALAIFRKPLMILGMALVACLSKQLVVPLLCLPFMCKANSCLAVLLEFAGLAGVASLTLNKMKTSFNARILTAAAGVFTGSVAYYYIGMHVRPCAYMLSFNIPGGLSSFILKEGLIWAIFSAVFFPVGWEIGETLKQNIFELQNQRVFSLASVLVSVLCWLACAVAISLGF